MRDPTSKQDRFFGPVLAGAAPFVVWGGHLFAVYALVGTGCARGLGEARVGGMGALDAFVGLLTLAALAAMAWLTWRACALRRREPGGALRPAVGVWGAVLGLVGVLYTAVPVLMLEACR